MNALATFNVHLSPADALNAEEREEVIDRVRLVLQICVEDLSRKLGVDIHIGAEDVRTPQERHASTSNLAGG